MNLTPAAILLLAAAALVGIVAQWTASVPAAVVWRLIFALVALGLAYELAVTRGLAVAARWLGVPRLYLGRHERLALELVNSSGRDVAVELAPVFPPGVRGDAAARTIALVARSARRLDLEVRATALGTERWPALAARVRGPLKLAWWSRALVLEDAVRVVPDTLRSRAAAAVGSAEGGAAPLASVGAGRELHHLREYRAGDPRHTIDWKASARATGLVTRVFTEDQHLEVMLLIDAGRTSRTELDGMPQLGHYANLAARFAEYCVAGDDQVGLMVFADRPLATLAPARGTPAVARIRAALAALAPLPVESDVLAAVRNVRRLARRRSLVVIMTDLYERSATSQLAQSTRLLVPKHLPLIVGMLSEETIELAERPARDWLDPYDALAAREFRRHVDSNVARLAELGAHALTARPRELDRKVLDSFRMLRAQRRV